MDKVLGYSMMATPSFSSIFGGFLGVADGPIPATQNFPTLGTAQQARYITLQFYLLRRKPQGIFTHRVVWRTDETFQNLLKQFAEGLFKDLVDLSEFLCLLAFG